MISKGAFYVSALVLLISRVAAISIPGLDLRQDEPLREGCIAELPNLSVGDVVLTKTTYDKFKKDNNIFILGLSDSTCSGCCVSEPMLSNLHQDL